MEGNIICAFFDNVREHDRLLSKEQATLGPGYKVTLRLIPLHPDVDFIGLLWEMKGKKEVTWREKENERRGRKKG